MQKVTNEEFEKVPNVRAGRILTTYTRKFSAGNLRHVDIKLHLARVDTTTKLQVLTQQLKMQNPTP